MSDNNTREKIVEYCKKYPKLQPRDLFKYLYQSAFGCEHMVSSLDNAVNYIKAEFARIQPKDEPVIEELLGNYCRVPLSLINKGVSPEKIGELFFLSAQKEPKGLESLLRYLEIVKELVNENLLPFSKTEFEEALLQWQNNNYQSLHHSDIYREEYLPSYRVVAKKYKSLLFQ